MPYPDEPDPKPLTGRDWLVIAILVVLAALALWLGIDAPGFSALPQIGPTL